MFVPGSAHFFSIAEIRTFVSIKTLMRSRPHFSLLLQVP